MKIVSFVAAASNSGKTTLIEKVVRILKERGLRVAVVKHASKGFDLDHRGKDSWRFREAGADSVVLAGPDGIALQRRHAGVMAFDHLIALAGDVDIVIVEGFKTNAPNKVEVYRSGVSGTSPLCATDLSITAVVSDTPIAVKIPRFDWNDATSVTDFIMTKL